MQICHNLKLKDGAIFIADAHYLPKRAELEGFLKLLISKPKKPPQLFLMGDIFDFLSSYVPYSIDINKRVIDMINALSLNSQVVIFEGNHDFNLTSLFPKALVVPRKEQPLVIQQDGISISLSHGDLNQGFFYECYRRAIESKLLLKPLVFIDKLLKNYIIKKIYSYLEQKRVCRDFEHFRDKASQIIQKTSSDIIIEGHYHQGVIVNIDTKQYIGLPSLVCKKSFFVVESKGDVLFFRLKYIKEF